ncbi:MAG: glycosyltransferase family 2 protein [Chitinophagaceae bacterium]
MPISVVIITYNEEKNISRTLQKLAWCKDIVIVDSFSNDDTKKIAISFPCRFFEQSWLGYGAQKNWGAQQAAHDWILNLDADEVLTDELIEELQKIDLVHSKHVAYYISRRMVFLGKIFNYGRESNEKLLRLYHKKYASFNTKLVHEHLEANGSTAVLKNYFFHFSYASISQFHEKTSHYSNLGAQQLFDKNKKRPLWLNSILFPFYFFRYAIVHLNILNGYRGLQWSYGQAKYHIDKYKKLYKLRQQNTNLE